VAEGEGEAKVVARATPRIPHRTRQTSPQLKDVAVAEVVVVAQVAENTNGVLSSHGPKGSHTSTSPATRCPRNLKTGSLDTVINVVTRATVPEIAGLTQKKAPCCRCAIAVDKDCMKFAEASVGTWSTLKLALGRLKIL
jgi:hypothetical protein